MAMNTDLLRRVADRIELEDRFSMDLWCSRAERSEDGYDEEPEPAWTDELLDDCGTIGCVAGWTCAVAGVAVQPRAVSGLARELLELDYGQADRLFRAWPGTVWANLAETHGWRLETENWSAITAVQAAKVLRQIADGEVEL